jgi:hypothetical protein
MNDKEALGYIMSMIVTLIMVVVVIVYLVFRIDSLEKENKRLSVLSGAIETYKGNLK